MNKIHRYQRVKRFEIDNFDNICKVIVSFFLKVTI